MRNITGQAVIGDDLYGREYELSRLWERLEQLEIVAANTDFQGREDWRRKALELARDLIGPNTPVAESIQRVFTAQYPTIQSNIDEWMQSGRELLKSDNYIDAERAYRKAVDLQPDNLVARIMLGLRVELQRITIKTSCSEFDHVLENASSR